MSNTKKMGFGIGVMISKDNKVLLGLRNEDEEKASSDLSGAGTWTFPGGKVDYGESIFEAVKREVKEETDLDVLRAKLISVNNTISKKAHYLTLGIKVTKFSGEVKVMEPEEIVKWGWFDLENLPERLYMPTKVMIDNYQKKKLFDINEKCLC